MSHDRLDEALRRLEALERHVYERDRRPDPPPGPSPPPPPAPDAGPSRGDPFDEKRVVDLIVRLVSEHVERIVERQLREHGRQQIDEKRFVDLIVGLVGDRVDEIVRRRWSELGDGERRS